MSRYGHYPTTSGESFLLGMMGEEGDANDANRVIPDQRVSGLGAQAGRLPSAPLHQGGPLPPRQRGLPPWRNSVIHDMPHASAHMTGCCGKSRSCSSSHRCRHRRPTTSAPRRRQAVGLIVRAGPH
jgi:hypothetical protein